MCGLKGHLKTCACHQLTCFSKAAQTCTDSSKHSSSCQQSLSSPDPAPQGALTWCLVPSSSIQGMNCQKQQSAAPKSSCQVCSLILQKVGEEGTWLECLAQCGDTLCFLNTKKQITFIWLVAHRRIFPSYLENANLWVPAAADKSGNNNKYC